MNRANRLNGNDSELTRILRKPKKGRGWRMIIDLVSTYALQVFLYLLYMPPSIYSQEASLSNTPPLYRICMQFYSVPGKPPTVFEWSGLFDRLALHYPRFFVPPNPCNCIDPINWFHGEQMTEIRTSRRDAGEEDFWPSLKLLQFTSKKQLVETGTDPKLPFSVICPLSTLKLNVDDLWAEPYPI